MVDYFAGRRLFKSKSPIFKEHVVTCRPSWLPMSISRLSMSDRDSKDSEKQFWESDNIVFCPLPLFKTFKETLSFPNNLTSWDWRLIKFDSKCLVPWYAHYFFWELFPYIMPFQKDLHIRNFNICTYWFEKTYYATAKCFCKYNEALTAYIWCNISCLLGRVTYKILREIYK